MPDHRAPSGAPPGVSGGVATVRAADRVAPRSDALTRAAKRALGGLLPLLDDPELRDLVVHVRDGAAQLWLDRSGTLQRVPGWEAGPDAVHRLATALIAAGGRHIDELHPCTDVRLGDGIRVHAMLPPIAVGGAAVSIRLPRVTPVSFENLAAHGLASGRALQALREAIAQRRNLLITGGTGSGKTTLLAALLDLAAPEERILTIEDVAELRLNHPHVVSLEARQASAEGVGEIGLDRLLREALRMRPDRIVLGECRGAEIATLLAALNTGHDGGAGTLHASRLEDVPMRLEALGALAGWSAEALARQAVGALHLIVHVVRGGAGPQVRALGTLALDDDRLLRMQRLPT